MRVYIETDTNTEGVRFLERNILINGYEVADINGEYVKDDHDYDAFYLICVELKPEDEDGERVTA